MPRVRAVRATRTAISPRLAMRSLRNKGINKTSIRCPRDVQAARFVPSSARRRAHKEAGLRKLWLAVAALCAVSASLHAAEGGTTVRAAGGLAAPASGDFDEAFKSGPHLSLAAARHFGRHFSVLGEIEYTKFPLDKSKVEEILNDFGEDGDLFAQLGGQISITGGDTTFLTGSALLKGSVLGSDHSFSPYVIAGGGATHRESAASEITLRILGFSESESFEGSSETAASVTFGAGFDFAIGTSAGLFVEGRYHIAFTDEDSAKYTSLRLGFSLKI